MINLNFLNIDLEKARKDHYEFYKCFITKKLTDKNCQESSRVTRHPDRPNFCSRYEGKSFQIGVQKTLIKRFLITENRLDDLILGTPDRLKEINDEFRELINKHFNAEVYDDYIASDDRTKFKPKNVHKLFVDLGNVIKYKTLADDKDYNSYTLANNLGVRSCTYCNRVYTVTERKRKNKKDGRLMSPQFDHWFPQSKFPLLQISFHNLIPSCEICNSRVKNATPFNLEDHFHPYQKEDSSIEFSYRFSFLKQKYQIYFKNASDPKILETCKKMFIDQMYDAHGEELEDLIMIKREYSEAYLDSLRAAFPKANLTDEMVYRLAFGTELLKEDFHKRPFSKFKYDILKELKIIKD